jgi:hypothetical protein
MHDWTLASTVAYPSNNNKTARQHDSTTAHCSPLSVMCSKNEYKYPAPDDTTTRRRHDGTAGSTHHCHLLQEPLPLSYDPSAVAFTIVHTCQLLQPAVVFTIVNNKQYHLWQNGIAFAVSQTEFMRLSGSEENEEWTRRQTRKQTPIARPLQSHELLQSLKSSL